MRPPRQFSRSAFTLIELLVVIAIVAILAVVVVLVLNPAEQLKQSRDSQRLAELATLNKAISLYQADLSASSLGTASTVYVSIPSSQTNCSNLGLPVLPSGWNYACAPSSTYRSVNGTGWIPIDFTAISFKSPLGQLPVDPVNSTSTDHNYYTYTPSAASWEFDTNMESAKRLSQASEDGGDSLRFEAGSNLSLNPFRSTFNFSDFPAVLSKAGQPGWYKNDGTGIVSLGSDAEGNYLRVSGGQVWYEWQDNIKFNPNVLYKLTCRIRQVSDPTLGGKNFYCGVAGIAANKTTYINLNGVNSYDSQYYVAVAGRSLVAGSGYTTYTGYFRGSGTPVAGEAPNRNNPARFRSGVEYFRPLFVLNYLSGNGTTDIQMEMVEIDE